VLAITLNLTKCPACVVESNQKDVANICFYSAKRNCSYFDSGNPKNSRRTPPTGSIGFDTAEDRRTTVLSQTQRGSANQGAPNSIR